MPRGNKIRWRPADEARLARTVNAFNEKIRNIRKVVPEIAEIQPQTQNVNNLKSFLLQHDRDEFNRTLSRMERYLRAGAEMPYTTATGVNITVWQRDEISNTFRSINAMRKAEMEKYQPSIYKGTMSTIQQNNLRPRKNTIESILPKDWEHFIQQLEAQRLSMASGENYSRYKENFLKAISNSVGEGKLYDIIAEIEPETLTRYYYTDPIVSIAFAYEPREKEEIENLILERLADLLEQDAFSG